MSSPEQIRETYGFDKAELQLLRARRAGVAPYIIAGLYRSGRVRHSFMVTGKGFLAASIAEGRSVRQGFDDLMIQLSVPAGTITPYRVHHLPAAKNEKSNIQLTGKNTGQLYIPVGALVRHPMRLGMDGVDNPTLAQGDWYTPLEGLGLISQLHEDANVHLSVQHRISELPKPTPSLLYA